MFSLTKVDKHNNLENPSLKTKEPLSKSMVWASRLNGAPSGAEFRPSLGNGGGKFLKLETCHVPKIAMNFIILCDITSKPPLLRVLGGLCIKPPTAQKVKDFSWHWEPTCIRNYVFILFNLISSSNRFILHKMFLFSCFRMLCTDPSNLSQYWQCFSPLNFSW